MFFILSLSNFTFSWISFTYSTGKWKKESSLIYGSKSFSPERSSNFQQQEFFFFFYFELNSINLSYIVWDCHSFCESTLEKNSTSLFSTSDCSRIKTCNNWIETELKQVTVIDAIILCSLWRSITGKSFKCCFKKAEFSF